MAELKQEQAAKKGDLRMIALKIEDLKTFTAQLFMGETFDHWLVREANIVTFNSFTIDGRIRQGYYSDEELETNRIEELSSWKTLRPFCYSLIRGRKLPESFQITLQLSPEENEKFIRRVKPDLPGRPGGGPVLKHPLRKPRGGLCDRNFPEDFYAGQANRAGMG